MVNLAGVERLPTPPFIDVVDTEPSGTVRFALLGETEHGVSMSLPTKFTVPSAARAAWADAASAMSTAALVRRGFHLRFLRVRGLKDLPNGRPV